MLLRNLDRVEARMTKNRNRMARSRPQAELRPKGPKMKAAGRYYGKDQADRESSDLSASQLIILSLGRRR